MAALGGAYGLSKPVGLLRGSRGRELAPWMLEKVVPATGAQLHGAGSHRSADWWQALAGMCQVAGLLREETRAMVGGGGGRAYSAVVATPSGVRLAQDEAHPPLVLPVSNDLAAEEARLAGGRAAATPAARAATDAARAEEDRLFQALLALRKDVARASGVAPTHVCQDGVLQGLSRARPASVKEVKAVDGVTDAFQVAHGAAFVAAILEFCKTSTLKAGVDFAALGRAAQAAGGGAAQGATVAWAVCRLPGGALAASRLPAETVEKLLALVGEPKVGSFGRVRMGFGER